MKEITVNELLWSSEEGSFDSLEDVLDNEIAMKYGAEYISVYAKNHGVTIVPTFKSDNYMAEKIHGVVGLNNSDVSLELYAADGFNGLVAKYSGHDFPTGLFAYLIAVPELSEDLNDIIDNSDGVPVQVFVQELMELFDLDQEYLELDLPESLDSEESGMEGSFKLSIGEDMDFSATVSYDLVENEATFFDFVYDLDELNTFVSLLEVFHFKKEHSI